MYRNMYFLLRNNLSQTKNHILVIICLVKLGFRFSLQIILTMQTDINFTKIVFM